MSQLTEQQRRFHILLTAGIHDAELRLRQNGDVHEEQVLIGYLASQLLRYREVRALSLEAVSESTDISLNNLRIGELGFLDPEKFFHWLPRWADAVQMPKDHEIEVFQSTYHPHHRS